MNALNAIFLQPFRLFPAYQCTINWPGLRSAESKWVSHDYCDAFSPWCCASFASLWSRRARRLAFNLASSDWISSFS